MGVAVSRAFAEVDIAQDFANLGPEFSTRVPCQPLSNARLLDVNTDLATELGLSPDTLAAPEFLAVVSGQSPMPNSETVAAVYSGHQFGVWAGQLGDGRAHLLGQINTPQGPQELQLKGSGKTPYSRMGDGRAVLRSSVREYLASEAMHGLGIATSRALALVTSDTPVYRETVETAAIVTRVAPSFIRFGTFEHWSTQPDVLKRLLDYVVDQFYPECRHGISVGDTQQVAERLLAQVSQRTAYMVADWQTVGFCHGVMNTDNMSILGLTIDYGPYGFMDTFQVNHVCNHSDTHGRYAWNTQPSIAHWNLYRLASALMGLDLNSEGLKAVLQDFETHFLHRYYANAQAKFGFNQWQDGDAQLLDDWWRLLHHGQADFTLAFRALATAPEQEDDFLALFAQAEQAENWLASYKHRLTEQAIDPHIRRENMNAVNPLYVLRNYLAEQAIQAAKQDDPAEIDTLLRLLRAPYTEVPGFEAYAAAPPSWAQGLSLSCSS
ncbi:protein adenylyltransferase SelO [Alcaligenes endophyticus]